MADNVAVTAGSGTTIAADDISGVMHQRVKLGLGADGTAVDAVGGSGTVGTGVMRVTLATDVALPAGTNAIGKLAANSGVDIGDVDVTTVTPGTGATNLGKAEDAAHASGDVGVMALAVRKDTAGSLAGADGDYIPLTTDSTGRVRSLSTLDAGTAMIGHIGGAEYEAVAASQTTQTLGATGAAGDYLSHVLVIPATTSPGAVAIKDGSNTAITVFTGGTDSVSNLIPFPVIVGAKSVQGAWQVTTGANVSALGVGDFT